MAAFRFRLAPVLRLRTRLREEAEEALRSLQASRCRREAAITALDEELRAAGEALAGREGEFLAAADLKLASEYAERIGKRLCEEQAALAALDEQILEQRAALVEAQRGVKALEKLRGRQAERYRRAQDAAEQKFFDEVARQKFLAVERRKKLPL